jgi:hypothetical protein
LHFQCLEVPTYVLNPCVHACFQVPMTFPLMRCQWKFHIFMILHHNECALKFFTFVNATIVRE